MPKEIIVNHDDIRDPQTITQIMKNKFMEHDLDTKVNEVEVLEDDEKKGVRRILVKNTKYFMT